MGKFIYSTILEVVQIYEAASEIWILLFDRFVIVACCIHFDITKYILPPKLWYIMGCPSRQSKFKWQKLGYE